MRLSLPSSGTTTIFSERTDQGSQPTSFAASVLVHGAVIALVWFVVAYKPPFARIDTEHYAMRKLDLHMDEMEQAAANARVPLPNKQSGAHAAAAAAAGSSSPSPAAPAPTAQARTGPQTLVQPDVSKPIMMTQEIPLPQVVIWTPGKTQVKVIQPPPPKPASSDVKPSVVSPNQELSLADVNMASSFKPSPKVIVQPSTTSPVQLHLADKPELPPATVAQPTLQPTPAQVMSLSDLRASNQTVSLPPVNETKASKTEGALAAGTAQKSPATQINPNAKAQGSGAGQNPAKTDNSAMGTGQSQVAKAAGPGAGTNPSANAGANQGTNQGTNQGANAGANNSNSSGAPNGNASQSRPGASTGSDQPVMAGATQITVPKDGRFGSVIVGDSLQDRYPELADVWSGRLTYTAYLHVGLAKNWILQYSLPRASDASHGGSVAHLDAPWPYSIVRPNLEPGSVDADALMIHGYVNQSGRFETLTILVPEGFPKAQFVLAALQQWQFRPASQDGQPARVEVLLIIPQEYE